MNNTNYEVPDCGAFSTPHPYPYWAQIFASGSFLQIPLAYVLPLMHETVLHNHIRTTGNITVFNNINLYIAYPTRANSNTTDWKVFRRSCMLILSRYSAQGHLRFFSSFPKPSSGSLPVQIKQKSSLKVETA